MSTAVAVKLHSSRGEQLRQIAAVHGTSVVGAIERFIRSEIRAGTIADALPGFIAEHARDPKGGTVVKLTIEGEVLTFNAKTAAAIGDFIEHLVVTRGRDAGGNFGLQDGRTLLIARKGTAIVIRITDAEGKAREPATLTFSMAADFCRSIFMAALTAQHGNV